MDFRMTFECLLLQGRSWKEKVRNVVKLFFKVWETAKVFVVMAELYARRPQENDQDLFSEELLVIELPAFGESSEESNVSDYEIPYAQDGEQARSRTWLYFESRNYRNMLAMRRSD